jgi:phosphate transport system substrate-binding protein
MIGVVALAATAAHGQARLTGAGATFPAPLYKKWVVEFEAVKPGVKIDYNSIGSGGGIKAITDKTVAFGATDAPLTRKEIQALGGPDKIVQVPTTAGAVVPAYNLPGVTGEVRFSGQVLADIYLGKLAKWNDPALVALNPDIKLPDVAITPVYRTDGSGTTHVFSSFLATQSEDFKGNVGFGKAVKWPVGQGGKGNEGVTAVVQQTPGSIGYIEVNYALANKIPFGSVQNREGKFVRATPDSIAAAGAAAAKSLAGPVMAADLWNQPGDASYPISAFTYIIVYRDLSATLQSADEASALTAFLRWAVTEGQKTARAMDYAPLAPEVQSEVVRVLGTLEFKGQSVK